ncbi:hypothetical protein LX73_1602 [Fodinibius salinus]|uniref:Uncharacterized protein n=1 Tax=Fodinibius salinus TaxID=860790 RepID=A0A5D3YLT1_9BACT|nr:hypothetical protein LX73_1602 [Fodinibius salinus]
MAWEDPPFGAIEYLFGLSEDDNIASNTSSSTINTLPSAIFL